MSLGVDFPLSNTCQFFRANRGEENTKIIAAEKGMRGEGADRRRGVVLI